MNESIKRTAISAARKAGAHISAAAKKISELEVEEKSRFDYVSRVDRESEMIVRECIAEQFPEHSINGEEFGKSQGADQADYQWIVDPLDGTTNFLRGIPHYAVSIAVLERGELLHGVVFDPAKDELFHASRGSGCFLNDSPVPPLTRARFAGSLLATGVPFSGKNLAEIDAFTGSMQGLLEQGTSGIRRLGAAALDLAYVAAGRYDGFWEAYLKPWDIAAGALLVLEAGGEVQDFQGGQSYLDSGDIVAGPKVVVEAMHEVLVKHYVRGNQ